MEMSGGARCLVLARGRIQRHWFHPMRSDPTLGRVTKPWASLVMGVGIVAIAVAGIVQDKALHGSVAAALMGGTLISLAIWAYQASRTVVLIRSTDGIRIRWRGFVQGPVTDLVLTEKFNVNPWHFSVSATCVDGSVVSGALYPPFAMIYSREEFKRQIQSFLSGSGGVPADGNPERVRWVMRCQEAG